MEATLKHRQVGDKGLFMSNGWRYTKADYFSISDLLSVVHPQCGGSTLGRRAGLCLLMSDGGIMKKPDRSWRKHSFAEVKKQQQDFLSFGPHAQLSLPQGEQ